MRVPRPLPSVLLPLLFLIAPVAAFAQSPDAAASTSDGDAGAGYDRFHEFVGNTIKSPAFYVEAIGAGVLDQAGRFPNEWDEEGHPFLKRATARVGQAFAAGIVEASLAEAFDYRVGYERCSCAGPLRRLGHAVVHTFVVSSARGGFVLNTPFLVSRYASAAIATAWYPSSYKAGDVVSQATFSFGSAAGLNILDEFGPDLLRLVHHH